MKKITLIFIFIFTFLSINAQYQKYIGKRFNYFERDYTGKMKAESSQDGTNILFTDTSGKYIYYKNNNNQFFTFKVINIEVLENNIFRFVCTDNSNKTILITIFLGNNPGLVSIEYENGKGIAFLISKTYTTTTLS